jgi:hypothetical protein
MGNVLYVVLGVGSCLVIDRFLSGKWIGLPKNPSQYGLSDSDDESILEGRQVKFGFGGQESTALAKRARGK